MAAHSRNELLAALNELLEAERAGARVTLHTAHEAPAHSKPLIMDVHHDEARWCAVLAKAIRHYLGEPSMLTGAFYDKAIAIPDLSERLRFLNRGQGWVVRRLETLLPGIEEASIRADLQAMLDSHKANIERVNVHLAPAARGAAAADS